MSEKSSIQLKIAKLDELLAWFDSEDFTLDEAVDHFEEAKKIAGDIEDELHKVKNRINVLSEDFSRDSA